MNGKKREFSLDDAVALLGDPRKLMEEDERFDKDMRYFHQNYAELVKQYPDHWVAIHNEEVSCAAVTQDELFARMSREGHDARVTFVGLLETKPEFLVL